MAFVPVTIGAGRLWERNLNTMLEELYGLSGGSVSDGDYGDIVVSGGVWTVDATIANSYKARANHTGTQTASTISDFAEAVDDRVSALLVAGSNVTLTYNDGANTLTVASSGSGAAWGGITGTLADQTDLNSALSGKQAASAILDDLAALAGSTADWTPYWTTGDVPGFFRTTSFTRGLLDDGNAGSARTTLGVVIGTDVAAASHTHPASEISDSTAAGRAMLTAADAAAQTALLDAVTSGAKGLAPASGGGTTNFLRADGTWAAPGGGSDPWTYVTLGSDNTVNTTALADVAGMSFTGSANTTYEVEIFGSFQTAATTTGIGIALNIPSGTVHGMAFAPSATTTAMITMNLADDTVLAPTTAVAAANTAYALFGKYLVIVGGTGGTVQLRQRSEVAGSNSVIRAGTRLKYRAL